MHPVMMVKAFQMPRRLKWFIFKKLSLNKNKPITINDMRNNWTPDPIRAARTFLPLGGRNTSPCTLNNNTYINQQISSYETNNFHPVSSVASS
jgi:hypothetical protein